MKLFKKYTAHLPNAQREIEVAMAGDGFLVRSPEGEESYLTWKELDSGRMLLWFDQRPVECRLTRSPDGTLKIEWRGRQFHVRVADDLAERARLAHQHHAGPVPLRSPIPGTVVKVLIEEGETVSLEQPLLIVEAMKMQNELDAPIAGKIVNLSVRPGEAVDGDQLLLEIRP